VYTAVFYFCTSLPTTATGWKPIAVNKYIASYITSSHIIELD